MSLRIEEGENHPRRQRIHLTISKSFVHFPFMYFEDKMRYRGSERVSSRFPPTRRKKPPPRKRSPVFLDFGRKMFYCRSRSSSERSALADFGKGQAVFLPRFFPTMVAHPVAFACFFVCLSYGCPSSSNHSSRNGRTTAD